MNKPNKVRAGILSVAATSAMLTAVAVPILTMPSAHAASSSYVTLNTFSGTPASTLTVSGGNYAASESVFITVVSNGKLIASSTAIATAGGEFSSSVTLPAKLAQGNATITATGQSSKQTSTNNYYVTPFTPTLTASANSSNPFAPLNVSGKGYAPNETVSLNFAGVVTTVTADKNGNFAATAITTPNVPAASYTLVGTGDASGASAIAYQYINAFYSSVSPTSYYVLPATSLGFNGSGFAAGETITVTDAATAAVLSTFKADATGGFTNGGAFIIPAEFAGLEKKFVLTGSTSQATASTTSTIGKYFPSVSPSIYYTMPGTSVGFNGSGFVPNESIDIMNGGVKVGTIKADAFGNLKNAGSILVPVTAAGTTQTYTLIGSISNGIGSASIQIGGYSPQVSPSSYYATPGSTVTFTGSGYAPGEIVTIFSGTKTVGTFTVGTDGTFTAAGGIMVAYNQANTTANYILLGSISRTPQAISFGVGQLSTQLTPSSYYVLPYEVFSVTATGFAPNEIVNLMNGTTLLATATTNKLGTAVFTNVSLPSTGLSSASLIAIGMTSQATGSVGVGLGSYYASVGSSDYYVRPGTDVVLSGSGFAAGETVTITAGATAVTVTADKFGAISTTFTVPFGSLKSTIDITAVGSKSMAATKTTLTLAPYTPQVDPSTYYATPGSDVTFTGTGYVAGETVTIKLGTVVVATATVDSKGGFTSIATALPYGTSAEYTITSNKSNTTSVVTVGLAQFYAGVQLDSYYGNGGSKVTATGSGYAANETVTLTAGSVILGTVKADKNGAFSTVITVPYATPGSLEITATGNSSKAASTTGYTVATVYNSVELGSYAVAAGEAVRFIGSGFFNGEPVVITTSRTDGSATIVAGKDGTFDNSSYVIAPTIAPGELTLTITGSYSHTVHTITIYVTPTKNA